jgi:micrococcal nuclease
LKRLVFLLSLLCLPAITTGADTFGPYKAEVLRVIDGDTIEVNVYIWPDLTQTTKLRLRGVDTPESKGKKISLCEKKAGVAATQFTRKWLQGAHDITISDVAYGKFAGRMIGRILKGDADLGDALVKAGHAIPYHGGHRERWC